MIRAYPKKIVNVIASHKIRNLNINFAVRSNLKALIYELSDRLKSRKFITVYLMHFALRFFVNVLQEVMNYYYKEKVGI